MAGLRFAVFMVKTSGRSVGQPTGSAVRLSIDFVSLGALWRIVSVVHFFVILSKRAVEAEYRAAHCTVSNNESGQILSG